MVFICMTKESVFNRNDIRGKFPEQIDLKFAEKLGKSIAKFFGSKNIVIGFDARKSSNSVTKALAKGLSSQGANVTNIGMCSTPMIYFACTFLKANASVMVTASHNPHNFTGFKITGTNSIPIGEDGGLKEIQKIFLKNDFDNIKKGSIKKKNLWKDYRKHVISFLKIEKPIRVLIDGGNSTPAIDAEKIFKGTKVKVTIINKKIISSPKHTANPLVDSNRDSIKAVKKKHSALGACFDFDGDRIFFIDEKGRKLPSYTSGGVLTESLLEKGDSVVCDNRFDRAFDEVMKQDGIRLIVSQVGHAKIKAKMRKNNTSFGLELSGHYYFKDNFYTDSGIVALVKMISALEKGKKPLSLLAKKFMKYYSTEELNFTVAEKEKAIAVVSRTFLGGTRSVIDGLRVDYPDWWFIIRQSQTQPLLRLIVAGNDKKIVNKRKEEIIRIIKMYS